MLPLLLHILDSDINLIIYSTYYYRVSVISVKKVSFNKNRPTAKTGKTRFNSIYRYSREFRPGQFDRKLRPHHLTCRAEQRMVGQRKPTEAEYILRLRKSKSRSCCCYCCATHVCICCDSLKHYFVVYILKYTQFRKYCRPYLISIL